MASHTKPGSLLLLGAAGTAAPIPAVSAPPDTRLWFLDHLRLVLICGVVVAHVAGLYAGGWYQYHDPVPADLLSGYMLAIPSLIAEMFGMGFFFLIAGYFSPGSYDRKGAASFVRDRLVRLGIPLLLYDLLLDPLVVYLARGRHGSYWSFYGPYLLQVRTIAPVVAWFIAMIVAVPFMVFGLATGTLNDYMGGFHWQALVMAVWEAFLVVGVCIGLLVLFRQHWNRQGRLAKGLAASTYTVYLIHPLVVVSVALAFSTVALYPLLKFGIAVLIVLPLSFLMSSLIHKLPLANRML